MVTKKGIKIDQLNELQNPIRTTWNNIAGDAMEFVESNEDAMEMVLDANRMTMFGYPEADILISTLLQEYRFSEIIKIACDKFKLI